MKKTKKFNIFWKWSWVLFWFKDNTKYIWYTSMNYWINQNHIFSFNKKIYKKNYNEESGWTKLFKFSTKSKKWNLIKKERNDPIWF